MATRLIDVPFTSGINETTDDTVLEPPGMAEMVNYRLTRAGRLEHRLGVQTVSLSSVVSSGTGAGPSDSLSQGINGRLLVTGGHGYTQLAQGAWVCNGSVSRYVPHESYLGVGDSITSYSSPSCTSVAGFLVIAARNSVNQRVPVRAFDELTGSVIDLGLVGVPLENNYPRLVACGSSVVCVIQKNVTGGIEGTTLDMSTFPIGSFPALTPVAAGAVNSGFDASAFSSTQYLISYYSGANVVVALVNSTTHAVAASASIAVGGVAHTAVRLVGSQVYLAWMDVALATVRCAVFTTGLIQIGLTQTVGAATATALSTNTFHPVIGRLTGSSAIVGYTDSYVNGTFQTYRTRFRAIDSAATLGVEYGPYYGVILASKPFNSSAAAMGSVTQPAVWVANYNPNVTETDRSHFLITLGVSTDSRAVWEMSASPSASQAVASVIGPLLQVSEVAISTASGALFWETVLGEAYRGLGTSTPQVRSQVYRFGDAALSSAAQTRCLVPCQGGTVVLGGAPRYLDGKRLVEVGFAHGPVKIAATPAATGSMTPGATYRYVMVIEYFDERGQRNLSYASSPFSVTLGGGDAQVNFEVLSPAIWAAPNAQSASDGRSVALRLYRTAANVGTVFRYSPSTSDPNGVPAGPNLANGRILAIQDINSDASIAANEAVYVQVGNSLSNYRSPPCRFGCEHEGRLVVAGGWKSNEFNVSKLFFPGEGIQFTESPAFTGTAPEPLTGCASLDGSLVLFSERSIYVVNGDGPTDDGAGSFGSPRRLPGRIGCVDWRSVVTNEAGVFFRSADGMYQLPRGLSSPVFIGATVKGQLRDMPETLGAVTLTRTIPNSISDVDSERIVAWLVGASADSIEATKLYTFSLTTGAWTSSSWPASEGNPHATIGAWSDLTNATDVIGLAPRAPAGSITVENPGTGYDRDISDVFEPLLSGSWKTGKIFPFGFGGRGTIRSVRIVGDCLDDTTLTPTVWTNANEAGYTGPALTFTAGRFAKEIPLRQKDVAWVQVSMADPTTGSANRGAGLRFNGLVFEVEMDAGLHRSPAADRSI